MLFKETYTGLRLREFKHRYTYRHIYNRMQQAHIRCRECNCKKSRYEIKRETDVCRKFWHCYPHYYLRYNLYRRDVLLSDDELRGYIPEFFFYSIFLPYYDSVKHEILLNDKTLWDCMLSCSDIPAPRTIAKTFGGRVYTPDLREIDFNKVTSWTAELGAKKLFVKPADGMGGYGIRVFHIVGDQYKDKNGESITAFLEGDAPKTMNYVVQEGLVQQGFLSAVYPYSINTFRIATENMNGCVRVVCSVLRFGRDGREIDNICQGGLILKVDSQTGMVGNSGVSETGEVFFKHPDTGFAFKNLVIPGFHTIRDFACRCAAALPWFCYLGWDIALTETGPVAIEANLGFALDLFQVVHGGLRDDFHITDPDFYWRNTGKRFEGIWRPKKTY